MTIQNIKREINKCTLCGSCRSQCPVFNITREESRSPRGRINLSRGIIDGAFGLDVSEEYEKLMNSCLLCCNCLESCSAKVDYKSIVISSRISSNIRLKNFTFLVRYYKYLYRFFFENVQPYSRRLRILFRCYNKFFFSDRFGFRNPIGKLLDKLFGIHFQLFEKRSKSVKFHKRFIPKKFAEREAVFLFFVDSIGNLFTPEIAVTIANKFQILNIQLKTSKDLCTNGYIAYVNGYQRGCDIIQKRNASIFNNYKKSINGILCFDVHTYLILKIFHNKVQSLDAFYFLVSNYSVKFLFTNKNICLYDFSYKNWNKEYSSYHRKIMKANYPNLIFANQHFGDHSSLYNQKSISDVLIKDALKYLEENNIEIVVTASLHMIYFWKIFKSKNNIENIDIIHICELIEVER